MSTTLVHETFPNPYAQIALVDAGTADLPDWVTGDEQVVSTMHAVYIATRPDTSGPIDVHVLSGEWEESSGGVRVFDGTVRTETGELEIGSPLAGLVQRVDIGAPGEVGLAIFVRPAHEPAEIWIHLVVARSGQ
jgi:hypothetical protein